LNNSDELQAAWKGQDDGPQMARIEAVPRELAALVRSRENLTKIVYWTSVAVTTLLAAGLLYNVFSTDQPWIRFAQAWAFGLLGYVLGTHLPYRAGRKYVHESCARFLERQHQERASGYLRVRRVSWLLVPSIVASWFGRGPLLAAQASGLAPSSWLFRFFAGPWPFFLIAGILALIWLAFGAAANKATREAAEIRAGEAGNGGVVSGA